MTDEQIAEDTQEPAPETAQTEAGEPQQPPESEHESRGGDHTGPDATYDLPFTVDQSHALDSVPVGTVATKRSASAVLIDHPDKGAQEHPLVASDVVFHLPVSSTLEVLEGKSSRTGKLIAVKVPIGENSAAALGPTVHEAMAAAWPLILKAKEATQ